MDLRSICIFPINANVEIQIAPALVAVIAGLAVLATTGLKAEKVALAAFELLISMHTKITGMILPGRPTVMGKATTRMKPDMPMSIACLTM